MPSAFYEGKGFDRVRLTRSKKTQPDSNEQLGTFMMFVTEIVLLTNKQNRRAINANLFMTGIVSCPSLNSALLHSITTRDSACHVADSLSWVASKAHSKNNHENAHIKYYNARWWLTGWLIDWLIDFRLLRQLSQHNWTIESEQCRIVGIG